MGICARFNFSSSIGWGTNTDYEKRTIREFLKQKPTELETGRTIIYGCSECGGIGCGVITAKIALDGDKIIWEDFGYETNYSGFNLEDYKDVGPFEFERVHYLAEFEKIAEELSNTARKKDE